jgi:hypothetical protein
LAHGFYVPRLLATGCGNTAGNASSARDEIVNLRLVKQMVNALFGGFRQNRCRPSNGDKKARQIMPGFLRCAPGMARSALTGAVPVQVVLAG